MLDNERGERQKLNNKARSNKEQEIDFKKFRLYLFKVSIFKE